MACTSRHRSVSRSSHVITVKVKVSASALPGAKVTRLVEARAVGDVSQRDVVKFTVKRS